MTTKKLPKNWSTVHLKDIAAFIRGVSYKKEQALNHPCKGFIPIIRANNIQGNILLDDLVYVPEDNVSKEQLLTNKDIVFAMSSGSKHLVGKSAAIITPKNISFGTFCGTIRVFDSLNKDFISYFFQTKEYRDYVSNISQGVNINNLKSDHIVNLKVPFPPLPEQKRIVDKIEKLFKQIDSSVATLQKTQEKISQFRDVIIRRQIFVPRKDFEYKQYPLGEALIYEQPTKYIVKSTKYNDSYKTPVLTPGKSFIKGYTNETFGIFEKDLPVIIFDDFTTASKFVTFPFKVKSSAMKILHINKEIANIQYIFYILSQIKDTKGTHKRYWISEYAPKLISLPLPTEQRKIVAEIEKQFAAADKMQKAVDNALENAKKLKQAILKKAFNGELVPQDPKDEPAASLLAKIKAEREASKHNLKQSKRTTK